MSLTTAVMILNISSSAFYSLPITIILYTGMTFVASEIVERCDIRLYKNTFCKFVENVVEASKGIQFYGAQEFVANKLVEAEKEVFNKMRGDVSKFVWKAFFYICFLFLTACIAYIAKIEFVKLHLFSATGYESLFLSFSFFYIVSCGAFFKFLKINDAITAESTIITHNALSHKPDGTKKLQENRIFIAFHGIYFQDSTKISDTPILSNVSFSALPGEQISITGENFFKGRYIFELILKYYSAQSGKIYISGIPIDNIQMHSLRASIGIFKQNFGIVRGTVYDNLAMLAIDESQILTISERVGLQDNLNNEVYDDYDADVSQEILFKIQIARIVVQKPKVILVETPQYFASGYVEEIFYAFVEHIAKKCTVFIMTNNPNVIIYSDKILYFGIGESLFGTHAELSKNKYYQDYVRSLNI
jgi:ABC-type multidrug transport system fused ATPase/permease subunit